MSSQKLVLSFPRVAHQISHGVRREFPSPHRCVLHLPGGFPYEAFDGKGQVKPWHVLNMVESGRSLSFNPLPHDSRSYLDFARYYTDYFLFIASTKLEVRPEMYDYAIRKSPLKLDIELLFHGKSSNNISTTILNSESNQVLAVCEQQSIAVSRTTRRPSPLPEWWLKKYSQFNQGRELRIVPAPSPSNSSLVSSHPVTVNLSDTDSYLHTNWSSYLKFCLEAVSEFKRKTQKENNNAFEIGPPVKFAELKYVKECSFGDTLNVNFWNDEEIKDRLNFKVLNSDNNAVLKSAVEYFSKSDL